MFGMYPQLPEDEPGRGGAASFELVSDQDTLRLDAKGPQTARGVLSVFIADLLTARWDQAALLLDVLATHNTQKPSKPRPARTLPREDYGSNWDQWQAKTDKWSKIIRTKLVSVALYSCAIHCLTSFNPN